jgi:hypothetical protein
MGEEFGISGFFWTDHVMDPGWHMLSQGKLAGRCSIPFVKS